MYRHFVRIELLNNGRLAYFEKHYTTENKPHANIYSSYDKKPQQEIKQILYSHIIQLHVYIYKYKWEHNQLIMTTSITNEYTSLHKSLTFYFRRGDVCCV